jgi:hypothetical protein
MANSLRRFYYYFTKFRRIPKDCNRKLQCLSCEHMFNTYGISDISEQEISFTAWKRLISDQNEQYVCRCPNKTWTNIMEREHSTYWRRRRWWWWCVQSDIFIGRPEILLKLTICVFAAPNSEHKGTSLTCDLFKDALTWNNKILLLTAASTPLICFSKILWMKPIILMKFPTYKVTLNLKTSTLFPNLHILS